MSPVKLGLYVQCEGLLAALVMITTFKGRVKNLFLIAPL